MPCRYRNTDNIAICIRQTAENADLSLYSFLLRQFTIQVRRDTYRVQWETKPCSHMYAVHGQEKTTDINLPRELDPPRTLILISPILVPTSCIFHFYIKTVKSPKKETIAKGLRLTTSSRYLDRPRLRPRPMAKRADTPVSLCEPQAIEFRYLELETPLPTPCISLPPGPNQSPPPEAPNLAKYTSPFLWPQWRKSMMTYIACGVTALAGYAAGEVSPAMEELTEKWGISTVVYNLSITIFCCGFALAPMVLAPFSEINGRRPIFIASGVLFVGRYIIVHSLFGIGLTIFCQRV